MFCTKCGIQINDDDRFCGNCGAMIRRTQISLHMQKTQNQNRQNMQNKQNKQQAISAGAVAGIIVAMMLGLIFVSAGVIGTVAWYNCPVRRIDRAIKKNDVETVAEIYGDLKRESEESRVRQEMTDLAEELKDGYLSGDMEYDEVMDTYDLLAEEILAGDSGFRKIMKQVEAVEDSRKAFAEADELYDEGDYIGAREKYMLVIEDDDLNYDDACNAIEECEKKITGEIVSTWSAEYDFSELMYYSSFYYDVYYSLPARLIFDFKENGTGSMSVEIINKDMWVAAFMDYYMMYFEEYYDVTEDELDEFIQYMGYESLEEWIMEIEEDIYYFEGEYDTFEYSYDGSILSVRVGDISDSEELAVSIEDDIMTLTTTSDDWDYWYGMGLNLPLVLTRDNAEL